MVSRYSEETPALGSQSLIGAGADTKVGIDIERCNLKASVEGLSARRSGAEVIVSIQECEFIRGDFIDGGIPSIWKITTVMQF